MSVAVTKANHLPEVSNKTLRNIANYIGVLGLEDAIEFLKEYGVPDDWMNPNEATSKMVYHALKRLANDNHPYFWNIVVESLNPSLYGRTDITERSITALYNEWLTLDGIIITGSSTDGYHVNVYSPTDTEAQMVEGEVDKEAESAMKSLLKGCLGYIAENKVAYQLVLRIAGIFYQKRFHRDEMLLLNDLYIELFKLLEQNIEYVHAYPKQDDLTVFEGKKRILAGGYIPPFVYQDAKGISFYYKPFSTLFLAPNEMQNTGKDWTYVNKRMNICYGVFEDRSYRFGADTITDYPHEKFLNEVSSVVNVLTATNPRDKQRGELAYYLASDEFKANASKEWKEMRPNTGKNIIRMEQKREDTGLTLHLKSGKVYYVAPSNNVYLGHLRPGSNGYLLLRHLMLQQTGLVLPYKELVLQLNKQHTNIDSDDTRRVRDAVQSVRKALKLKEDDDFFITNFGFGLNCTSRIEQTNKLPR